MELLETECLQESPSSRSNKQKKPIFCYSPVTGVIFVFLLYGLFGVIYVTDDILPAALSINDEKNNRDAFIAERAQRDLEILTNIGPRVAGTPENEVEAVEFFRNEISHIHKQKHPKQVMEMDVQTVSGSYYLDFKPYGGINAYAAVQNIIVKLYSKNNSEHSLLVNAHFDSVATSPGGSDDGINCVTMLEVLRKLSQSPEQLEHNVIFLFNGAEETPVQASHGFITQHKWAKEVQVVVNLEASGAGGKEILFQAGPNYPWLLNYYQRVPHPNGQAAGEELFKSGVIPSGTDFRIFRDFGDVIGMDFAFSRGGYRYHTKFDGFTNIPAGSYQHVGDNALFLIRSLANAPELPHARQHPMGETIFFDFLGLFMICYSKTVGVVVNVTVSLISLAVALKSFRNFGFMGLSKHLLISLSAILLGWAAGGVFVLIVAVTLDALKFSMSWYNNPWIILGLYVSPVIFCACGSITLLNCYNSKNNLGVSAQTQVQAHLLRLIWTVPLLVGTSLGLRFVYTILIPLLFHTLTFVIIHIFCLQHSGKKWQIIYVLGTIVPNIFLMKQALQIMAVIVPICGRMGSTVNPELYIGFLTFLLTVLIISYYTPLVTLVDKPHILLASLSTLFFIFLIIVFTPLGFPYSGSVASPAPQRFWIYHMNRVFHNETNDIYKQDAGFFLLNLDRNSPHSVKKYVKDLSNARSVMQDCNTSLFCGLPMASTRMVAILHKSTWIPAEQPVLPQPISLKLNSKISVTDSLTQFNFTALGANHMTVYISPRPNVKLNEISLISQLPSEPIIWNERPIYIILYTWAKEETSLTFSVNFEVPRNWKGPSFDIAVTGKYMDDKRFNKTSHYAEFLSEFPEWTDVTAWLGTFESWIY